MKLTTGIRKRFRVSNRVKRVAPKDRFRFFHVPNVVINEISNT